LLDRYDVDPAKVRVVPNGIEPDDCDVSESTVREFRREHGLDPSTPTVLFVGRLVPWKNPGVLVESITTHLSDLDLDVVVVGEGEQEFVDDLKQRADERFTFIPGLPWRDLLPAYFASDVFVILSKSEGLSTVVLEAMNGRLPIVTTPVGALDDVVTNGTHGLTVEQPPSPNAVADALRHYCENPDERRRVGQRNREYVRESYAWADVADRIEETYEELRDAD
jgi:glycosyltransferase involved in cell wall biosynthesis